MDKYSSIKNTKSISFDSGFDGSIIGSLKSYCDNVESYNTLPFIKELRHNVEGISKFQERDGNFSITFDCHSCNKDDLKIKIKDNNIYICNGVGKIEKNSEKRLTRRYTLPSCINSQSVKYKLNRYGDLIITGKKKSI